MPDTVSSALGLAYVETTESSRRFIFTTACSESTLSSRKLQTRRLTPQDLFTMATAENDEWEYEYDETETEDFYITLDLSNVPEEGSASAQERESTIKASLIGNPILLQSRLRHLNAARRQEEHAPDADGNESSSSSTGAIQISGLHTDNPLVYYDNHLVSCTWGSTIGTDLFFVKPNPDASTESKPLRSLPAVDLLAVSATKLMGTDATLRPSDEVLEKVPLTPAGETSDGKPTGTKEKSTTNSNGQSQSVPANSFLARLNEAKAKRGETSRLMVSQGPSGNRLISTNVSTNFGPDANAAGDTQIGGV